MAIDFTLVTASNNEELLRRNLLASPCLQGANAPRVMVQRDYSSAAAAYNSALDACTTDLAVFVHHDVLLPKDWPRDLEAAEQAMRTCDPEGGVLGCWGRRKSGEAIGYLYSGGQGVIGTPLAQPEPVQSLDEVLLVVRRSSGLRFDDRVPGFHFYGASLCVEAARAHRLCYAVSDFCIHNSEQYFALPPDLYSSYRTVKKLWIDALLVQTSCIRVSRWDADLWNNRLREWKSRLLGRKQNRGARCEDPLRLMNRLLDPDGRVRVPPGDQ